MSDQIFFKFELVNNGTAYEVSRGTKKSDEVAGAILIPESHEGKPVIKIAEKGFFMCQKLTSVTIPESVEVIGKNAFASCHDLENVVINYGVKEIEEAAFHFCRKVKAIVIPDSVNTIGNSAFYDCKELADVTMPENVKMGGMVFYNCKFKLKK